MVQRPRGGLSIQWLAIFIAARGRALYFFPAMTAKRFARESDLGLRERDYALLRRLDTPQKIQAYLHDLKQNFELDGDSCRPVREVLRTQRAHCIEGAMLAAAALWVHGEPPRSVRAAGEQPASVSQAARAHREAARAAQAQAQEVVVTFPRPCRSSPPPS